MWDALQDTTLIILMVAAVISLVFGLTFTPPSELEWIEGVAILVTVAIVVFVASFNDYQKEKQFKALQAKQEQTQYVEVIRNGQQDAISAFDLVVGDVLLFSPGNVLPADGIMVHAHLVIPQFIILIIIIVHRV